ncbi:glucan endo-1,3-beta-glucosidase [Tanacetum coccineum]
MASNLLLLSILILKLLIFTDAQSVVGVCNGRRGNGLPSEQDVVNLYQRNGITKMRIYDPNQATLQALGGTNIELILDVPNASLQELADPNGAASWVRNNILNYPDVKFRMSKKPLMTLNAKSRLANIYPYFAYIRTPSIELSYALFTKPDTGDQYKNLFDAMYDAHLAAQSRLGGANVPIVVSESGWPSAGDDGATMETAATYYRNLIAHVKSTKGTPLRPGRSIETYLFAMFDEDQKQGKESEKHFGVFSRRDQSSKYNLRF